MKMSKEDCLDLLGWDACLQHSLDRADAAINQIWAAVQKEQRAGFRAIQAQGRPAGRAEEQNFSAIWRPEGCAGRRAALSCRRPSHQGRYNSSGSERSNLT